VEILKIVFVMEINGNGFEPLPRQRCALNTPSLAKGN
jgi:hypothetical protein